MPEDLHFAQSCRCSVDHSRHSKRQEHSKSFPLLTCYDSINHTLIVYKNNAICLTYFKGNPFQIPLLISSVKEQSFNYFLFLESFSLLCKSQVQVSSPSRDLFSAVGSPWSPRKWHLTPLLLPLQWALYYFS